MDRRSITPNMRRASPLRVRQRGSSVGLRRASVLPTSSSEGSSAPWQGGVTRKHTPSSTQSVTPPSLSRTASPSLSRTSSPSLSWRTTAASEESACESGSKPHLQRQRSGSDETQETSIRVMARVRPMLPHESRASDGVEVDIRNNSLTLANSRGDGKSFVVDDVFDSRQEQGSQENVFSTFARDFVNDSLNGYNICMFAYGHTGSGKTYTMLGDQSANASGSQAGILPRFLRELFSAHAQDSMQAAGRHYSCEFYEVYNEQIKDLLVPGKSGRRTRKVHVHPKHGVRIESLTMSVVNSAEEALQLVEFGNQMRAVAATTMNARSSRSHAVFNFKYEQQTCDGKSCRSTVTFVDLAGRENQSASQNQATQFREMCCINTSLFHLANVISKLSQGSIDRRSLADFRNSKLTLLLSPALIGNSRTALIATVSPLKSNLDDSLCTMNFAASVKKIKTRPVINNKAPNTLVAELEAEVRQLHSELAISKNGEAEKESALLSAHALISNYKRSWEDASAKSQQLAMTRQKSLRSLGLAVQGDASSDIGGELVPFFTKLSDDPAIQGHCNYFLREKTLRIGSDDKNCAIVLQGLGILAEMCEVKVAPCGSLVIELLHSGEDLVPRVLVNGYPLSPADSTRRLSHGTCVFLGYSHAFRVVAATHAMALEVGSTDACVLARSTIEKLDAASAVSEIVDETGEQFKEILPYVSNLSARVAGDAVHSFMAALHRICPLIDEANLITKEVCGDEGLHFELHALTNVFNFSQDVPELVVCLLQSPSPLAKFRRSVQTVIHERKQSNLVSGSDTGMNHLLGKSRHPLVHAMGLSEHMLIGGGNALLYVWSLEKFLGRLTAIREIYQEGSEAKDQFAAARRNLSANPHQNPWREIALGEVHMLKERGSSLKCCDSGSLVGTPLALAREECHENVVPQTPTMFPAVPASWLSQDYEDSFSGESSSCEGSSMIGGWLHSHTSFSEEADITSECDRRAAWTTALLHGQQQVNRLSAQVAWLEEQLLCQEAPLVIEPSRAAEADTTFKGSEDVTRWLSQVEELRNSLPSGAPKRAAEADTTFKGSEDVTRWLSQVEELRNSLRCGAPKLQTRDRQLPAPTTPSVPFSDKVSELVKIVQSIHADLVEIALAERQEKTEHLKDDPVSSSDGADCSAGKCREDMTPSGCDDSLLYQTPVLVADEVSQHTQTVSTDMDMEIVKEELQYQLPCLKSALVRSNSGSTDCSSGSHSSFLTPPGSCEAVVYLPRARSASPADTIPRSLAPSLSQRSSLTSDAHGYGFGSRATSVRKASPAPQRPSLVTRRHYESSSRTTSAGAIGRPSLSSGCSRPRTRSPSPSGRSSPSRRFVGPYPKVTWAYYEVLDSVNALDPS